jgi:hypothetical protein
MCALFLAMARRAPAAETQPAAAQQEPPAAQEAAADSDPLRTIVGQIREEYADLPGDAWQNTLILRRDVLILKNLGVEGGRKGILARVDVPMVSVHTPGDTDTGLGDLYAQAIFLPRLSRTFGLGAGTGFYFPTATLETTGTGKWSVAPLVVPVWFFPGLAGYAYVKVLDIISFAGDADRPDLNVLIVTPTGVWKVGRRGWVLADTEVRRDWKTDLTSQQSGVQLGTMFGSGRGIWIKAEVPWGPNQRADWLVKTSFYLVR